MPLNRKNTSRMVIFLLWILIYLNFVSYKKFLFYFYLNFSLWMSSYFIILRKQYCILILTIKQISPTLYYYYFNSTASKWQQHHYGWSSSLLVSLCNPTKSTAARLYISSTSSRFISFVVLRERKENFLKNTHKKIK